MDSNKSLWLRCSSCKEFIYRKIFEANLHVCPVCGFHYRIPARSRIDMVFDSFEEKWAELVSSDVLGFEAGEKYADVLVKNREKTGLSEACITGIGTIENHRFAACVFEFNFMGGSMGKIVGEKIVRLFELAADKNLPVVVFTASGGARMQEGMLSLIQMARTVIAVEEYKKRSTRPYICIMLNPTTGGVLASFAALADITVAEPNALIGFTGPRVIEKTVKKKLPPGFQRSEYLYEHGFLDAVIERSKIREKLLQWCR